MIKAFLSVFLYIYASIARLQTVFAKRGLWKRIDCVGVLFGKHLGLSLFEKVGILGVDGLRVFQTL